MPVSYLSLFGHSHRLKTKDCKPTFRVRFDGREYVFSCMNLVHPNWCTKADMMLDCSRSRLTTDEVEEVEVLFQMASTTQGIREHIFRGCKKVVFQYDSKNFKYRLFPRRNLNEFIRQMQKHGKVLTFPSSRVNFSWISFAREEQIELYRQYPEVVGIQH